MEEIFDALYPQYHGELAKVLVSEDPRVYGKGGLLDQFKHNDLPRIAISVDMLDTGIDVREIVNLVFAKPVYAYTKFWQMIGRGTRLLVAAKIKPLFHTVSQVDFKAMRFEKDLLELSLALLGKEKAKFETLKEGIVEQIGELPLSVQCRDALNL